MIQKVKESSRSLLESLTHKHLCLLEKYVLANATEGCDVVFLGLGIYNR